MANGIDLFKGLLSGKSKAEQAAAIADMLDDDNEPAAHEAPVMIAGAVLESRPDPQVAAMAAEMATMKQELEAMKAASAESAKREAAATVNAGQMWARGLVDGKKIAPHQQASYAAAASMLQAIVGERQDLVVEGSDGTPQNLDAFILSAIEGQDTDVTNPKVKRPEGATVRTVSNETNASIYGEARTMSDDEIAAMVKAAQ